MGRDCGEAPWCAYRGRAEGLAGKGKEGESDVGSNSPAHQTTTEGEEADKLIPLFTALPKAKDINLNDASTLVAVLSACHRSMLKREMLLRGGRSLRTMAIQLLGIMRTGSHSVLLQSANLSRTILLVKVVFCVIQSLGSRHQTAGRRFSMLTPFPAT